MSAVELKDFEGLGLRVRNGRVQILDQRLLPKQEVWLEVSSLNDIYEYVMTLAVRGAPMIGCAVSLSLAQWRICNPDGDLLEQIEWLRGSRPTAVNLGYCCNVIAQLDAPKADYSPANIVKLATELLEDEIKMYQKIIEYGVTLMGQGECVMTYCNTGALATPAYGTALGVIIEGYCLGKVAHVYVNETRPLLQGARLTAYELQKAGVPYTIICDNSAAHLMRTKKISRIIVGADRIAINGDCANKIGTYSLAICAAYHLVPFHVVAPMSTVDCNCDSGSSIPIEQRSEHEVFGALGTSNWSPNGAHAFNPAFDVTPVDLITSIVLNCGIVTRKELNDGYFLKHKK